MSADDLLRNNPGIHWLTDADMAEIGVRAEAELDDARTRLAWADKSLDDLARALRERAYRNGGQR